MQQSLKNDIIGGITTFLTMSYIVILNPAILSTEGTGMSFNGVLTATVLLCFTMTLLMGLYAKLPYAVAPGLGVNAFFTYTVILAHKVPWPEALGAVFWAGVLFLVTSVTPLRAMAVRAIPKELRAAAAVGIGFFLTFIGFKNAGFIQGNPDTLVSVGPIGFEVRMCLIGLVILLLLYLKKNPLSFLISIATLTIVGLFFGKVTWPESYWSTPDFSSEFFKLDIVGSLRWALLPTIVSIFFTDFFDSISTFVGVAHATGLVDADGQPKNMKEGLVVDAFATLFAGLFGTSSGTAYIESASGIEAGGRSGRSAVVTALCFLPCFFIAPLAGMVPAYATAPVLIFVGFLMFRAIQEIDFHAIEKAIPSFLTVILIPLTFSITQGILWGFIAHVVMYWATGKRKQIDPVMYGLCACCALLLYVGY